MSELGPFFPDKAGDGLFRNKHSWNAGELQSQQTDLIDCREMLLGTDE
jgi:hypothetical protein